MLWGKYSRHNKLLWVFEPSPELFFTFKDVPFSSARMTFRLFCFTICIFLFRAHFVSLPRNVQRWHTDIYVLLLPWVIFHSDYHFLYLANAHALSLFLSFSLCFPSTRPFFLSLRANWGVMVCKWTCKGALVIINRHLCLIKYKNNLTSGKKASALDLSDLFQRERFGILGQVLDVFSFIVICLCYMKCFYITESWPASLMQ